jgi:GDPmannose 4,6-dehydratase
MRMKKALITGITGQDGSYLAELLLAKGYEVHGIVRRSSTFNSVRIDHLYQGPQESERRLLLHFGDLSDGSRLATLIAEIQPDEIYNLAAQSHVRVSFDEPVNTGDVTGIGATRMLEAVLASKVATKFYQASSSEMFGSEKSPQSELTEFRPRSPYAAAKLYSHWMTVNYREAHGLFAVSGVLFNHESPRRGSTFVTRKISRAVADIKLGRARELYLGNLKARRDWGYAPEYVVAMWRMLQQDEPKDLVIGTGVSASVEDFLRFSFLSVGLNWEEYVRFDSRYLRPTEVDDLMADPGLAESEIGWKPEIMVEELASEMVRHDLLAAEGHVVDTPIGKTWEQEARE